MKKAASLVMLAVLTLLAVNVSQAEPLFAPPYINLGFIERMLALTPEQQTQVATIVTSYKQELSDLNQVRLLARTQTLAAMNADTLNEQAISDGARNEAQLQEQIDIVFGRMLSQIRQVLSEQQKQQLDLIFSSILAPHPAGGSLSASSSSAAATPGGETDSDDIAPAL